MVDLGTGCGVIPLILAFRRPGVRIWGVELQAALAAVAEENVRDNDMASRVTIVCADMRDIRPESVGGAGGPGGLQPALSARAVRSREPGLRSGRWPAMRSPSHLPELVAGGPTLLKTGGRF
ncbi:MAG: methyltransferase [Desulfobacterales bacterium]|nr:methyltransferase [Desulfobacterales bacterium]